MSNVDNGMRRRKTDKKQSPLDNHKTTSISVSDIGGHYEHADGGDYRLIGKAKIKNKDTREWEDGVIYMEWPSKNPAGENDLYVREKSDFESRFKKVRTSVHSP